jgi:hypothetical protein
MEFLNNALQICRHCNAEILIAGIHTQIGGMYNERCGIKSSLNSYDKALSIYKNELGSTCIEVGKTLISIGATHDSQNNNVASFKYYSEALTIIKDINGNDDLDVALVFK